MGGHIRQGRQKGRQTGNTVRRDKQKHRHNKATTGVPASCLLSFRSGSCLTSRFIPRPAASLAQATMSAPMRGATLRTCVQHVSGRRPGLVLADQPSSTMLPELPPSHPGNRLVLYRPTSASQDQAGPRNTNHESDNRHTCPVPGTILTSRPPWRCATPPPSARQPYLASLTKRRSTQHAARRFRCPLFISVRAVHHDSGPSPASPSMHHHQAKSTRP